MKIAILGQEGYIGTALTQHLRDKGFEVCGLDNELRAMFVRSFGGRSVTEKEEIGAENIDILDYEALKDFLARHKPDTIIHLAHQPSAPFSMSSPENSALTQQNNTIGTLNLLWAMREVCPDAHLICLGTEGEYGADVWDGKHIPEGGRMEVLVEPYPDDWTYGDDGTREWIPQEWTIPTPRYAGSFYHWSKVFSDYNIDYACKIWGLTATNIQQGIVYSHRYGTRLDIDECFGTIVHRFVAQAVIGEPITVYGTGGQTRGFINLQNSLEAIELLVKTPAEKGEFRVIHQTTEEHTVKSVAEKISNLTGAGIKNVENPRAEMSENTFTFDTSTLDNLGLKPLTLDSELPNLIDIMKKNKKRIIRNSLIPKTKWN